MKDEPGNKGKVPLEPAAARRLGEAIADRSLQLRLSQRALADRSGISRSQLVRLASGTGRLPLRATLDALERALEWPSRHACQVSQGTNDPAVTYAVPVLLPPDLRQLQLTDEWIIVLRQASARDTMTQRSALEAARRIVNNGSPNHDGRSPQTSANPSRFEDTGQSTFIGGSEHVPGGPL
jgi:hypothetical protein